MGKFHLERGWHTVYIRTDNDPNTALAYDNDPAVAAICSWRKWRELVDETEKIK